MSQIAAADLDLQFSDPTHVSVSFNGAVSGTVAFENPLTPADRKAIAWYLETYGATSLAEPDDAQAKQIEAKLVEWGVALFNAVFSNLPAQRVFTRFQDDRSPRRALTISSTNPTILSLPWELLHEPTPHGNFLFLSNPRISIRRKTPGVLDGQQPLRFQPKDQIHLLFVVSRPKDAGFIDPRLDGIAVMNALEKHAPGRVTWEFLSPPTLEALVNRLEDETLPPVDILHFDGHGVFDRSVIRSHERKASAGGSAMPPSTLLREEEKADARANTGYLLFEDTAGGTQRVAAMELSKYLKQHNVPLAILSACQSAAHAEEDDADPIGSVAVGLNAAGIPAVVAMTHSVLIYTTEALFGEFYANLAKGRGIGESLDNARRHLEMHPARYKVRRGKEFVDLRLQDWFVPNLYETGADGALLSPADGRRFEPRAAKTNLSKAPEAGFFGRRRELWKIERWFALGTKRITVTGFGGQGKTALAQEAARWLTRTGQFEAAVFVGYADIQALDAVGRAVSHIGAVLGAVPDVASATGALRTTKTLVVLDNLEALKPEALQELLSAAALWSEAGGSRVLCTSRQPDFGHSDYRTEGTREHLRIQLDGLGTKSYPEDALDWLAELMRLPPEPTLPAPDRQAVIDLFDRVRFHPLSIRVLAQQLKSRPPEELAARLEELLATANRLPPTDAAGLDTPESLLASLELSLDKLSPDARAILPRLGVFSGGAFEDGLIAICGFDDTAAAANAAGATWHDLRTQLEAAGLIEAERLDGVGPAFLRFHPTLAPMLWDQLDTEAREGLSAAHRAGYYDLAAMLYRADRQSPRGARRVAWIEMPNLLRAVHSAIDVGDVQAIEFAGLVSKFLSNFAMTQEASELSSRSEAASLDIGCRSWLVSRTTAGERAIQEGRLQEALGIFQETLANLASGPSYDRALTVFYIGRCWVQSGRPDNAETSYREGLEVCQALEQTSMVRRHSGLLLSGLGDALAVQGRFDDARAAQLEGLAIAVELGDLRSQAVSLGQLGTLAMHVGNLTEAIDRHRDALEAFRQLGEPSMESVALHELGSAYRASGRLEEAERCYRESARIAEALGNLSVAADTWNAIGLVSEALGRAEAAETWFRKALEAHRQLRADSSAARDLQNLGSLLSRHPQRLSG